jgi:hypothetical protein
MINTLTSVLSARSKVRHLFKELLELVIAFTTFYGSKTCASGLILASECQAAGGITDKAQLLIEDIDKSDGGKELAVVDYIEDIYKFYKIAEVTANISALQNCDLLSAVSESHLPGLLQRESRPLDYIGTQVEMNSKMRAVRLDHRSAPQARADARNTLLGNVHHRPVAAPPARRAKGAAAGWRFSLVDCVQVQRDLGPGGRYTKSSPLLFSSYGWTSKYLCTFSGQ